MHRAASVSEQTRDNTHLRASVPAIKRERRLIPPGRGPERGVRSRAMGPIPFRKPPSPSVGSIQFIEPSTIVFGCRAEVLKFEITGASAQGGGCLRARRALSSHPAALLRSTGPPGRRRGDELGDAARALEAGDEADLCGGGERETARYSAGDGLPARGEAEDEDQATRVVRRSIISGA
jgi:hypothetical protein